KSLEVVPMLPNPPHSSDIHPFAIGEGTLGIPLWAISAILSSAWQQLRQHTAERAENGELPLSAMQSISQLAQCILALNPDHHTA
ncbi:hypothetical protein GGH95_003953, partial [Coemansia sp. RSA 1836]